MDPIADTELVDEEMDLAVPVTIRNSRTSTPKRRRSESNSSEFPQSHFELPFRKNFDRL